MKKTDAKFNQNRKNKHYIYLKEFYEYTKYILFHYSRNTDTCTQMSVQYYTKYSL